jgi:glycosyltransferase involved in cell wall biosynthesis
MAAELGLQARITWAGECDGSTGIGFREADLFVLATRGETYGMAVGEAISHGLPVVSTRTGEIASIVGDGGLLAEPGDLPAFTAVLRQALEEVDVRQRLAAGARHAAARLPTWDSSVDAMERVITRVASGG